MLENKDHYLQIFIEPKGMHLLEKEQWKEDLLLYINQHESELVFEDKSEGIQVKGLKFYTMNDSRGALNQFQRQVELNS